MSLRWCLTLFLLVSYFPKAHAAVQYYPERKVWVLQAGEATYAMGVNERGELQSIYWGPRVMRDADFSPAHSRPEVASFDLSSTTTPQEYPGWGAELYNEPALKATYANGNRDVVLHFVQQHIDGETLQIDLKDIASDLQVHLYYKVYPETGILQRWSSIENHTDQAITLESAQSAAWSLPHGEGYGWRYLTGHWGAEWQLHSEALQTGAHVIESRRGSTSSQANPWFAIDRPDQTTEENGPVWFGALGWSGSWRITVEQTAMQQVRVTGGFNSFDFGYRLKPGEQLETPPFYAGFTNGGFGEPRGYCTASSGNRFSPAEKAPACDPSSITHGKPRNSMSARQASWPWRKRPANWAWSASSSTTDGSANAKMTTPALATGT